MSILLRTFISTLLFFSLVGIESCQKDPAIANKIATPVDSAFTDSNAVNPTTNLSYDTIYPLSYLPAYPGSYWQYVDDSGNTSMILTDSIYKLDYYMIGGAAYVSDSFYVPVYNNFPLWRYEEHSGPISNAGSYPLKRLLSDSLPMGSEWGWLYWSGSALSRKIIAIDTTLVINGISYYPTIGIEQFYSLGPPFYIWQKREYYAKDIGLVKVEEYNSLDSTIFSKVLVNYFINH
jgi:hypothetical protein